MTAKGLNDKLRQWDVERITHDAIEGEKSALIELNRDQLRKGEAPDGGLIGRYGSMSYAKLKNSMNSKPGMGNVDLIYTGNFINDFVAEVDGVTDIDLFSRDSKMDLLDEKYPGKIFGLTEENRARFRDVFYNRFKAMSLTITGLEFK